MSLNDAQAFAFSLATTLMAAIVIFQAGDGTLSVTPAVRKESRFPLPPKPIFGYSSSAPWWWWRRDRQTYLTEATTMIILAILASLAAIGALCWLLFTLAVFALPAFVGVTVGAWAHGTGAGVPGAILIGFAATLAVGQVVMMFGRPVWLKLIVAIAFVAPAALAGFHATHGIVKHLMPSEVWQISFSVVSAIAVGITALMRVAGMATAPASSGQGLAQA